MTEENHPFLDVLVASPIFIRLTSLNSKVGGVTNAIGTSAKTVSKQLITWRKLITREEGLKKLKSKYR